MSKVEATRAVGIIAVAYPRQEFPLTSQKLYAEMLADLDDDLLIAAVQDLISKQTFLPAIAEIRAAVAGLREQASGRLDAYSAWEQVKYQMLRVGSYGDPQFDDLTNRAVKAVGGWRELCLSENGMSDRARFIDAYNTFLGRERSIEVQLPGVRQLVDRMSGKLLKSGEED